MKKVLFTFLPFLLLITFSFAQTTLSPTDIIIVTVNSDGDDTFDFVPLVNLDLGTEIYFTEKGWDGSSFVTNEGTIKYTAPSAVSKGTIISYPGSEADGFSSVGGNFGLANGGDNLLVYQGDETNPTFIYGIGWGGSSNWLESGSPGTGESVIPDGLIFAKYTIVQLGSTDNYQYNTANGTIGNAVDLQALVSDVDNWNKDDVNAYPVLSTTFTITSVNNLGTSVVIAEIYPGGGNTGATYKNDYIILYNPTGESVDLSNYSIQYAPATSTFGSHITNLNGSIASSSYYGIQEYSNGDVGSDLPFTPDATGTIDLALSGGKVALVSNQDVITGAGDADVLDFVGYGTADEFETAAMDTPGNSTSSLRRKDNNGYKTYGTDGSGYDTGNNSFDFYIETDLATNQLLPVELVYFDGKVIDKGVLLEWGTATEVNNFGFQVERRKEKGESEWELIGFVPGHGSSNSPKEYFFTDPLTLTLNLNPSSVKAAEGKLNLLNYRLKQIDNDGTFAYSKVVTIDLSTITTVENENTPNEFLLLQNYPNPFNPTTVIGFQLPAGSYVSLIVYNLLGQEVKLLVDKILSPGSYEVEFDGSDLPSGIYFYKLETGNFSQTKKMVLLR